MIRWIEELKIGKLGEFGWQGPTVRLRTDGDVVVVDDDDDDDDDDNVDDDDDDHDDDDDDDDEDDDEMVQWRGECEEDY